MNDYTEDMLRLVTRERHARRTREADAERLAHQIRGTLQRRRRLRLPVELALGIGRWPNHPRLEA
jgi:hypothetical protein